MFRSFFYGLTTVVGHGFLIAEVSRSQSNRRTTFGRNPLDDGSARRRDLLPVNAQHTQETVIHAAGGIRTRNPSQRTAAASRLTPRGHRDRH